ncbi:MAG TPA: GH3 auxin-responsive promoter family protein [Bacteroidia bacterium]|nr:GH3 auxin-responsive promoter family protein [Bacteroidia bacterium]HNT80744.1 GH3 auxin-responsive promoter family protein [Bacteroidia bacterium]
MSLKSILALPFAKHTCRKIYQQSKQASTIQQQWFERLIQTAKNTSFGQAHSFATIRSYSDYCKQVPFGDYEQQKDWFDRIKNGEENVSWPGKPLYLSKTSGTTSGIKYIPISKESISNHIRAARNALLFNMFHRNDASLLKGYMIFLSGSPELSTQSGIPCGRLSGIVNHHVPSYLRSNQLPSYATNCINDWEEKLDRIVDETMNKDMRLISGIPPWVQMYFDKLQSRSQKSIAEIFPNFDLFVYGGVNFEPYRSKIEKSIGKKINSIELYPASEGFIAYQDLVRNEGLLLNSNDGIFYEFVPLSEYHSAHPIRLQLHEIELGVNYALLLSTNAGLWSYSIGDTVKFVSKDPYRLIVTGRVKHFISAFGEHVIAEEVDKAMQHAGAKHRVSISEFTVAPQVNPSDGLPYHEWFIEFDESPSNVLALSQSIDESLQTQNIYYRDLIEGKILQPLKIIPLRKNAFVDFMKANGKLGGQNKVPRLSNNREMADQLLKYAQ